MAQRNIFSLSVPGDMLREMESIAKKEKLTKSQLFRMAINDLIGRLKWEKAVAFGRRMAREMKITEEDIEGIVHEFRKK